MIGFIFEQYGYYPTDLENNEFIIKNWRFRLIEVEGDNEFIEKVEGYLSYINKNFTNNAVFIIKSRTGSKITVYDGKKFVLISILESKMNIKDLSKFHMIFNDKSKYVSINNLINTWEDRVDYIEKNAISALRVDSIHYPDNLECAMYLIGQSINAIQYLSDMTIDFDDTLSEVTLTHKRILNFNSFDFFNPFNYIVDHPARDVIELYKNDYIEFTDLIDLFDYYKLNLKTATYTMARALYPSCGLDELENNVNKNTVSFKLNVNIGKDLQKCKKIYAFLKEKYGIRPIAWLEN